MLNLLCHDKLQALHLLDLFVMSYSSGLPFFVTRALSSFMLFPSDIFGGYFDRVTNSSCIYCIFSCICINRDYRTTCYISIAYTCSDANILSFVYLFHSSAPKKPHPNRSLVPLLGNPHLASFENHRRTEYFGISTNFSTFNTWKICLQGSPMRIILRQLHCIVCLELLAYNPCKTCFDVFFLHATMNCHLSF
jgi:hypothetical protein